MSPKENTDPEVEPQTPEEVEDEQDEHQDGASGKPMTMEERKEKMRQLRAKMQSSALANRASVIEESSRIKSAARDLARLEKQPDAEERGEDVERQKNWEWTIEENEEWEKKLARKARRADFEFHDDAHAARRKYKKDYLEIYNRQKETAMGLAPGTLSQNGSSSFSLTGFDPAQASGSQVGPLSILKQLASESLYRDANSLLYADNKPSDEAIDRVIGKINQDIDKRRKFSRKRPNEDSGDVTYINEKNRIFNKKIARYYDKYTAEIRASFERGTAL
ncbi:SYF2-domain-containing protein [Lactarius deliciosus]|nr:SYF2-domain-containing protein [Lactarius deliciosus]